MGFFDNPLFDFNNDGHVDGGEMYIGLQMMMITKTE